MKFEEILDFVMPDVPGAEIPFARQCIRESAIRFFRESTAWREEFEVNTGGDRFPINAPITAEVVSLHKVTTETGEGVYSAGLNSTKTELVFDGGRPASDYKIVTALVSLMPSTEASEYPSEYRMYNVVIARGAAYRMMMSQDKPYTNPDLGALYYQEFLAGIREAQSSVTMLHSSAMSNRVKAHYF